MPSKNSTAHKLNTQPALTTNEVKRIAEELAMALNSDTKHISLLTLLLNHLDQLQDNGPMFAVTMSAIKNHLFINTSEGYNAQEKFQTDAYANRGKLLRWPYERKGDK